MNSVLQNLLLGGPLQSFGAPESAIASGGITGASVEPIESRQKFESLLLHVGRGDEPNSLNVSKHKPATDSPASSKDRVSISVTSTVQAQVPDPTFMMLSADTRPVDDIDGDRIYPDNIVAKFGTESISDNVVAANVPTISGKMMPPGDNSLPPQMSRIAVSPVLSVFPEFPTSDQTARDGISLMLTSAVNQAKSLNRVYSTQQKNTLQQTPPIPHAVNDAVVRTAEIGKSDHENTNPTVVVAKSPPLPNSAGSTMQVDATNTQLKAASVKILASLSTTVPKPAVDRVLAPKPDLIAHQPVHQSLNARQDIPTGGTSNRVIDNPYMTQTARLDSNLVTPNLSNASDRVADLSATQGQVQAGKFQGLSTQQQVLKTASTQQTVSRLPTSQTNVHANETTPVTLHQAGVAKAREAIGLSSAPAVPTAPIASNLQGLEPGKAATSDWQMRGKRSKEIMSSLPKAHSDIVVKLDLAGQLDRLDTAAIAPRDISTGVDSARDNQANTVSLSNLSELNRSKLATQIQTQITSALTKQAVLNSPIRLQLQPRELGSLVIELEHNQTRGELQIHVIARESTTRDLLDQYLPRLKQSLADAGITLGDVDVKQESNQPNEQHYARREHSQNPTKTPRFDASQADEQATIEQIHDSRLVTPDTQRLFEAYV